MAFDSVLPQCAEIVQPKNTACLRNPAGDALGLFQQPGSLE
jgi:hypothetical protein